MAGARVVFSNKALREAAHVDEVPESIEKEDEEAARKRYGGLALYKGWLARQARRGCRTQGRKTGRS